MISVSPLAVEDVEVVTLELEEASDKVAPALEQVEDEEEDDIVEVGRVRRRRTVRRSTGVGGKAPHLAINFRQVRKSLPVASKADKVKEVPEYFDVEDEDEADEEGVDDVQVSEDPFASVEITALESQEKQEENNTDDFCDVCGQSLPTEQMEGHREKVHGLVRLSVTNQDTVEDEMESFKDIPREPRKVARKSTKPPRNPQESVVPLNQFDDNKVDDFAKETFETPAESRKVAKKSTRPPRNPDKREDVEDARECVQIGEESKAVDDNEAELKKDEEDVEIINEANCGVETSETTKNESESGLD